MGRPRTRTPSARHPADEARLILHIRAYAIREKGGPAEPFLYGLGIHYDRGEGHPLLGRRMPDLDLVTATGPLRVFILLHDARPVVLNLGEAGGFDITPLADRVQLIDAAHPPAQPSVAPISAAPKTF